MLPPAVETACAVVDAHRLFSQTNTTGALQSAARLTPSWNGPRLAAPSPKIATTTWSVFLIWMESPTPAPRTPPPPPGREPAPRRQHAVGPQVPHGGVGDVHGPALAFAAAGGLAVELGHQGAERASLGDKVAMAAVGGEEIVVAAERRLSPQIGRAHVSTPVTATSRI